MLSWFRVLPSQRQKSQSQSKFLSFVTGIFYKWLVYKKKLSVARGFIQFRGKKKRSHHMQTRCLYVGLIRRGEKNPKVHDWPELLLLVKTIARNDYPNSLDGSLWMVDRHYYSRLDRAAYRASLLVSSLSKFLYCQLSLDPPRPAISN